MTTKNKKSEKDNSKLIGRLDKEIKERKEWRDALIKEDNTLRAHMTVGKVDVGDIVDLDDGSKVLIIGSSRVHARGVVNHMAAVILNGNTVACESLKSQVSTNHGPREYCIEGPGTDRTLTKKILVDLRSKWEPKEGDLVFFDDSLEGLLHGIQNRDSRVGYLDEYQTNTENDAECFAVNEDEWKYAVRVSDVVAACGKEL